MKCNYCGAKMKDDSLTCPKCGKSLVEDEYLYARYVRKNKEKEHKTKFIVKRTLTIVSAIVLVLALIIGTYSFTNHLHNSKKAPVLSFTTGTGLVNDEKVVYLTIQDSSAIEYIHGVNIYSGDVDASNASESEIVSSDYEYTKDSNDSFRSIFFYAKDLDIKKDKNYTFTFEMTFGFSRDVNSYTYYKVVDFSGDIKNDLSDIVFDHKMDDNIESDFYVKTTEPKDDETTTEEDPELYKFIYTGYWYSQPRRDGNTLSIDVWSFDDGKAKRTTYTKNGDSSWKTKSNEFVYLYNGSRGHVRGVDISESYNIAINSLSKTVDLRVSGEVVDTLEYRNNNSIENVEDKFDM